MTTIIVVFVVVFIAGEPLHEARLSLYIYMYPLETLFIYYIINFDSSPTWRKPQREKVSSAMCLDGGQIYRRHLFIVYYYYYVQGASIIRLSNIARSSHAGTFESEIYAHVSYYIGVILWYSHQFFCGHLLNRLAVGVRYL